MLQNSKQSVPYTLTGSNPYPWIRWWYALVAPRASGPDEELSLKEREFLRRGKLTSIALLINLVAGALQIGPPLQAGKYATVLVVLVTMALLFVALFLNRARMLLSAGLLITGVVEIGIVYTIATPDGGLLSFTQLPYLVLLIQPLMMSVLLLPAWSIFIIGAMNCFVVIFVLTLVPQTAEFHAYMATPASVVFFAIPIVTIIISALVSFIVITSLQESLTRADKAEEVNKLHQILGEQTRRELQTKQQLEMGVQEIVTGMTHFANGDLQARIQLERGHMLWSVASSLNNLIGRFVRIRGQAQEMEKTYSALQSYLTEIRTAKVRGTSLPQPHTGTPVDALVEELVASLVQPSHQAYPSVPQSQEGDRYTSHPSLDNPYTSRM